jgi:hypothetical protein
MSKIFLTIVVEESFKNAFKRFTIKDVHIFFPNVDEASVGRNEIDETSKVIFEHA